ncbi:MAG TPA: hypothetical protein GX712_05300 [Bacteroidales bacterium]|jgi:Skp family chaperone for outer membrane proteins|nr:hypothetical protein [Bacteroidales bacterium]
MKKFTLLALVGLLTLSFSLSAQNNNARRSWTAKDRAEYMTKELNLSAEESAKIKDLFEKNDEERAKQVAENRAKREDLQANREARRKEMQDMRAKAVAENDAQLEAIIGNEKMEEWKVLRAKRQESNRDANRSGRRAPRNIR